MKVALNVENDWDSMFINGVMLIPNGFDEDAMRQMWREECVVPATGRNQYGTYTSKTQTVETLTFWEWLSDRFEVVEFIELDI